MSTENTTETVESTRESNHEETGTQVGLTDISYEGHTVAKPPSDRVTVPDIDYETFFDASPGDVLWIDGGEYVVIDRTPRLLGPSPVSVVGPGGRQGGLIAGELPSGSTEGVMWIDDIPTDEEGERDSSLLSREHLLSKYDRVYKLESGSIERIHEEVPSCSTRDCPLCGTGGDPLRIERQALEAVEIRRCTDTDCKHTYRYVRDFPEEDTASVLTRDYDTGTLRVESVTGVFRCEEQDDFKLMFDTTDGRDDGFYTASEIAEFVNPKMSNPQIADLLMNNSVSELSVEDVFDAPQFTMVESSLTGVNEREVNGFGELYSEYIDESHGALDTDLAEALSEASASVFFNALCVIDEVEERSSWNVSENPDMTDSRFDPRAVELLISEWGSGDLGVDTDPAEELVESHIDQFGLTPTDAERSAMYEEAVSQMTAFLFGKTSVGVASDTDGSVVTSLLTEIVRDSEISSVTAPEWIRNEIERRVSSALTARDVLQHRVFHDLLDGHTDSSLFGAVSVDRNRSGELVIEWRDAKGYDKKMRVTFTGIHDHGTYGDTFGWYAERHDFSSIAP